MTSPDSRPSNGGPSEPPAAARPEPQRHEWIRPLVLMAAGAFASLMGAAGQDVLEDGYPARAPIVVQLPDGQVILATGNAAVQTSAAAKVGLPASDVPDCPPAVRAELARIDFWSSLQDAHHELQQVDPLIAKNEKQQEKIDRARDNLGKVLEALAKCK